MIYRQARNRVATMDGDPPQQSDIARKHEMLAAAVRQFGRENVLDWFRDSTTRRIVEGIAATTGRHR